MADSTAWVMEELSAEHDVEGFACGESALDSFLKNRAVREGGYGYGKTFVAVAPPARTVLGYYTLSTSEISRDDLSRTQARRAPYATIPAIRLGRLAADRTAQGQGLGEFLLTDALARAAGVANNVGVHLVEVDAMSEKARQFYLHFEFTPLQDDPHHLYIAMAQIRQLDLND